MKSENNLVTEWLEKFGDPSIEMRVDRENSNIILEKTMNKIKLTEDGIVFDYHFSLDHVYCSTLEQVEREIWLVESRISDTKVNIFGFAMMTPVAKEGETRYDVMSEIRDSLNGELEYLEDCYMKLFKLRKLKEVIENEEDNK